MIGSVRALLCWTRVLIFGATTVWIASLWNPFYVTPPVQAAAFVEVDAESVTVGGDFVGPVLSEGVSLTQRIFADGFGILPDGGVQRIACVRVSFVTFQRSNAGEVRVVVSAGGTSHQFVLDASRIEDWQDLPFCIVLEESDLGGEISVTLTGSGAGPEESVAPLLGVLGSGGRGASLPAEIRTGPAQLLPTPASGPLALELTVTDILAVRPAEAPWINRTLEWALPLGLPMVVAVLVVMLLVLEIVPLRGGELRTVGVGLGLAGVLVVTIGLAPAAADRDLVPLRPGAQNDIPVSTLKLDAGERISQVLPIAQLPSLELGRDGRGQRQRFCIAVPIVDMGADDGPVGTLEVALALGASTALDEGAGRRELAQIVDLREAGSGPPVACFRVAPRTLGSAEEVRVSFELTAEPGSRSIRLATRPARSGESTITIAGWRDVFPPQVVDVQLLREAPSYRESVLARIGHAALVASLLLLAGPPLLRSARRATRRDRRSRPTEQAAASDR